MFLAFSAQEKPLQKKLRMWMSQRLQYSQEIVSPLISMNLPQDKGKPKAVQFLAANKQKGRPAGEASLPPSFSGSWSFLSLFDLPTALQ